MVVFNGGKKTNAANKQRSNFEDDGCVQKDGHRRLCVHCVGDFDYFTECSGTKNPLLVAVFLTNDAFS
jgi:hypothetical protein